MDTVPIPSLTWLFIIDLNYHKNSFNFTQKLLSLEIMQQVNMTYDLDDFHNHFVQIFSLESKKIKRKQKEKNKNELSHFNFHVIIWRKKKEKENLKLQN